MTDEAMPKPAGEALPDAQREGESVLPRPFVLQFPRASIPGTELTIRSPSVGQDSETWADVSNEQLDDREFTVRLVHRQLDGDQPIEEVRIWSDQQLLAAASAYLSLDAIQSGFEDDVDDELREGETAPADLVHEDQMANETDESEPLTLAGFRNETRQHGIRQAKRMRQMMSRIAALSDINTKKLLGLMKVDPPVFKGLTSTNVFKALDTTKFPVMPKLAGLLDANFKGIELAKFGALSDTSKIGEGLSKMLGDTTAMERFTRPPLAYSLPSIAPIERPEIRLLGEVGETLEKMHDDQARTAEDQIDVMVQQTALLKYQGVALTALMNDAKSQKWNRRALLAFTALAAGAALAAALYAGHVIRPFDAATTASSAPIASSRASANP